MRCPICDAESGPLDELSARGYQCMACGAWPSSTWWLRAARQHPVTVDVGDTVDRFHVVARLGEDVASTRFEARDGNRRVLLHVFRPSVDATAIRTYADNAASLRCPHVITPLAVGMTCGMPYVALPLQMGKPLRQQLGTASPWLLAVELVRQICVAIRGAHAAGLVIGLDPAAMYVDDSELRIDLFAQLAAQHPHVPTFETKLHPAATIEYLSPEQLMGKPLDGRSDIYSLGVIAYQLVTGRLPFPDARGPAGLVTAQLKQRPVPPSQLVRRVPAYVDAAILRCLEKDKLDRFPGVDMLRAALDQPRSP